MEESGWFEKLSKSKWFSVLLGGTGGNFGLLLKYLHPITLRFKNADLERHYYEYCNEDYIFYTFIAGISCTVLFLLYIPLDASYDNAFGLMLMRAATAAVIFVYIVFLFSSTFVRRHNMNFVTFMCIIMIVSTMGSLILRDDVDFSPLFMVLLFANLHFAAFVWHRTITGFLLILADALVWMIAIDKNPIVFLRTQTLSYVLFYISAVLAAYLRELSHRRVYLQIHEILVSTADLKNYTLSLSSSTENFRTSRIISKSATSSSKSLSPSSSPPSNPVTPSASMENVNVIVPSPSASTDLLLPAELSSSVEVISGQDSSTISPAPSSSDSPTTQPPPIKKRVSDPPVALVELREAYVQFKSRTEKFFNRIKPSSGKDALVSEIGYHRAVFEYIQKLRAPVTLRFRDVARERLFSEWHLKETSRSLQRFLVLNILSVAFLVLHDISFDELNRDQVHVLFIIRFAAMIPALIICFAFTFWPAGRKWRNVVVLLMEVICAVAALGMGLFTFYSLKHEVDDPGHYYDLYFGYVVRFIVYGFCGMGLLWLQSTLTAAGILIVIFVTTLILGVPIALTPILLLIIGAIISYSDDKSRRAEFFLSQYREEVVAYICAKEQTEGPSTVTVTAGDGGEL